METDRTRNVNTCEVRYSGIDFRRSLSVPCGGAEFVGLVEVPQVPLYGTVAQTVGTVGGSTTAASMRFGHANLLAFHTNLSPPFLPIDIPAHALVH